eukprot:TRINITY_DN519_c2_g1_i1.p1 TRINITY_DN519_c2_g1~~TRINITY_DN519_c2_g1_i1.p1  ORF type:complete len:406 (+),score=43.06 TRINITY_DN519_c2_g1_i1:493-1710(+)
MLSYLQQRERHSRCGPQRNVCRKVVAPYIPRCMKERELSGIERFDKVFAAKWLDHSRFAIGTKDNRLVCWDVSSSRSKSWEIALPARPCPKMGPIAAETCGIHSITLNAERTLLATGGANPCDTAIFHLPSFEPASLLIGHEDWMFASAWLSEDVLVTGSRDKTLKLWGISDQHFYNNQPVLTREKHKDKIRDLKYRASKQELVTLSQDTTCKVWDAQRMEVTRSVSLLDKRELVCLAVDESVVVVGAHASIAILDLRCHHCTPMDLVKSAAQMWGVRSLSIKDSIVTCGAGKGRISFFDLRTKRHIQLRPAPTKKELEVREPDEGQYESASSYWSRNSSKTVELICHSTGKGTVDEGVLHNTPFQGQRIQHAVYAHEYDVTGTKLLAGGGPLPFGLKGCYLAIW